VCPGPELIDYALVFPNKMICNGVEQMAEKCSPVLDSAGQPSGDHGVMVVG
jgi:hypothetical protein